ncbi:hypothetical protein Tco_0627618 [Tanacetum coccineum]|uniref:Uncharacterized protein n=1 Tax=Tanacetum coccineum TaxID=301880 RepID=A0ABQ4WNR9_9ASTR
MTFFWAFHIRSPELGPPAILATIDATPYIITEDSVRGRLQLADDGGIDDLPIADIYSGMDNLGYVTEGKLPFYKNSFHLNGEENLLSSIHFKGMTDQPPDHLTAPPRQQPSDPIAPVFEHGQRSDPDIASFSQVQETHDAPSTSTNVEDEPLGGSFHASPPRSTPASPAGHTSGGAEDPITLTALSAVVSTLVQKVHSLETELKAHKQLFKVVVGKLVKQVKAMEVKLKTKKRKVVVSDSDIEDGGEQDVDLEALHALANAAVTVDSTKSPGGASSNSAACSDVPTSDVPTTDVPTHVPSGVTPTGPSTVSPGSTIVPTSSSIPAAEPIPARIVQQNCYSHHHLSEMSRKGKRKRLGWEAAQRLQAQELADLEKQRAESLMKDANLARQMSQDFEMTKDQRKRQQEVLASAANYSDAAWDIILACLQTNPDLSSIIFGEVEEAQVEVPSHESTVRGCSISTQTCSSPRTLYHKKLLGKKGVHTSQSTIPIEEGDPDAEHKLCIKYASDEDSASDCDTHVHLYAVVDWELLPTGADLMTIYGRVMTFYEDKKAEGVGLVLWGDLQILMDSPEVNDGSDFWKNQHTWSIQNWKLYSFSGVHVLETVSGLVIHMFVDKKYPLTINLIERMLDHQLEICHGTVGNELTTAV